jgi:hypothetical protein
MSDPDIDRLYQVPLGEFTSARNALAKARGADGAAIKTLEKPTLPAWAVNQVYWQARKEWDALTEASMAVRQAHVQVISGRPADVATAEATHQRALRAAAATAQRLAEAAGEKVTGATAEVIMETLQALPSPDTPGMLTRPLKPLGFGALMAMGIPVTPTGGTTRATQHKPSAPVESPAARAKAREARKAAEKTLKKAEAAESAAEQTLNEAQSALTAAERELARVRDRLVFLEKQRSDADDLVRARRRELQDATNTRIQAAQDLAAGMD